MPKNADWYYHRRGCTTCGRSQAFLESREVRVKETVNAGKDRLGPDEALKLARSAAKVIVTRGKRVLTFDMTDRQTAPDDATLLKAILGPTGNLRAPTVRRGKTLLVGFDENVYDEYLT